MPTAAHRVVVVGGGFGGLFAVKSMKRAPVQITLVDKRNFHLFQPLLYQVATGTLSAGNIAASLRSTLKHQKNVEVVWDEVTGFDVKKREVLLKKGSLPYDSLIVAAGSEPSYFGNKDWAEQAPGLKTLEDAIAIRSRILRAFEEAERERDPAKTKEWLTFVIVGGGPTGVEVAGAIAEVAHKTLRNDFRHIRSDSAKILLINTRDHVLPEYPTELSIKAEKSLEQLGVTVVNNSRVTGVSSGGVTLNEPPNQAQIKTRTIVWAAGVRASPLGDALAQAIGTAADKGGRVPVGANLSVPGFPEIFVIGDLAAAQQDGKPLPGVAPVAMQEGQFVAKLLTARLEGKPEPAFRYWNKGSLATIGRNSAVADLGRLRFGGFIAWLIWALVHLLSLVEFEDRFLVASQWIWNYVSFRRSDLLITFTEPPDATPEPKKS